MKRSGYSIFIILALIFTGCSDNNSFGNLLGNKKSKEAALNPLFTQDEPSVPSVKDKSSKKAENETSSSSVKDKSSTTTQSQANPKLNSKGGIRLPEVEPLNVKGNILVAGSSTIFPLTKALYNRFIEEGYPGTMKIDNIGSGAGFRLFCKKGESDILNASRAIKDEEVQACAAINRKPIGFRIGTDALAIVVNPANNFVKNVTLKELAAIFTAEKWSDVNPNWPKQPIQRFIPDANSGTLNFFVDQVFNDDAKPILNSPNTQFREDDEDLVDEVSANQYAISFFGYAYYHEHAKTLKILSIEGVEPDFTTVEEGKYPLARPLFMYSDANIIKNKPQVAAFINYFLTHVNQQIEQVGYFPASQKVLDQAKVNWLKAEGYEELLKQPSE